MIHHPRPEARGGGTIGPCAGGALGATRGGGIPIGCERRGGGIDGSAEGLCGGVDGADTPGGGAAFTVTATLGTTALAGGAT